MISIQPSAEMLTENSVISLFLRFWCSQLCLRVVEVDFSDDTYGEYLLGIIIAPGDSGAIVGSEWFILTKAEILTENTYLLIFIKVPFFPCFRPRSAQATLMLLHQALAMMPQGMGCI